jgi:ADP-ribose pyrophosphatase
MKNAGQEPDPLLEETIESRHTYSGIFLNLYEDQVRCPDGRVAAREYVRHPGAVVVIPVLPDGQLLFERQYRYPLRRAFIELPAGKIDPGEDILACARRELEEETGYLAEDWRYLGVMHPCIGYSDERIEIFLARELRHVGHNWDEGEYLEFLTMSLEDAGQAVLEGRITDSKTITALFWAEKVLAGAT